MAGVVATVLAAVAAGVLLTRDKPPAAAGVAAEQAAGTPVTPEACNMAVK